jgi:ribosomal protein S18 acetylase RimI-like enzyme
MIRRAVAEDLTGLNAFLRPRAVASMAMLASLREFGVKGPEHPTAMTFWVAGDSGIRAVFAMSVQGYLTCQMPALDRRWRAGLHRALGRRAIAGMYGDAAQIATLRGILGLETRVASLAEIVPLFGMNLTDLTLPDGPTRLRMAMADDAPLVMRWRRAFDREVFGDPDTAAMRAHSARRANGLLRTGQARILEQDGRAVAMTGFSATLPDIVQVGSVYTLPEARGRGHARRAVALHLAEARAHGVAKAVLNAATPGAARAYRSIGFARIGDFTQIEFADCAPLSGPHPGVKFTGCAA